MSKSKLKSIRPRRQPPAPPPTAEQKAAWILGTNQVWAAIQNQTEPFAVGRPPEDEGEEGQGEQGES